MSLKRGQWDGFRLGCRGHIQIGMPRTESLTRRHIEGSLEGRGEIGFAMEGTAELYAWMRKPPRRAHRESLGVTAASLVTV